MVRATNLTAALAIGAAVFLINDFVLDFSDAYVWVAGDYIFRMVATVACLIVADARSLRLVRPASILEAVGWVGILIVVGFVSDRLLLRAFPEGGLWSYPGIDAAWLLTIDTALGIPLVAFSEELTARGLFLLWAERRGWRPGAIIVASAVLFAAFHWSLGPASMLSSLLFGALAMFSVMVTRSLWPAVLAHWAVDILLFSLPSWSAVLGQMTQ